MQADDPSGRFRITRDEALSQRVDGLLQRQKSLLGDSEGRRERGRRWYYQNWFVFMMAAGLAAFLGWAIIEPFFDDLIYLQGKVSRLQVGGMGPSTGSFSVGSQELLLLDQTREIRDGSVKDLLKASELKEGQDVGVYVEYLEVEKVALAVFVDTNPTPISPGSRSLTMKEQQGRKAAGGLLSFAIIGGLIGLAIGAVDGLICRLMRRALLAGTVGLLVGFVGGFFSTIIAGLTYSLIHNLAMKQMEAGGPGNLSPLGFGLQMIGRSFAWMLAGMAMGLGQGIALRSKRLVLYGFLGGIAGGLLGGLLFDPIDMLLLGPNKPSAFWSRLVGFTVVGLCVGGLIGVVELLARDAWLRMLEGPLSGKEFLIFKDRVNVGCSPRSDIYLFNDPLVAGTHATIRTVGDQYEIENLTELNPALINGRRVERARLRHGDQITIGRTVFVFQQRQS